MYTKVKVEDYQPGGYELRTQRKRRDGGFGYAEQIGAKRKRVADYASYYDASKDSAEDDESENLCDTRRSHSRFDDYLETGNGRRSTRLSTRASSHIVSSDSEHGRKTGRVLRLRPRASVTFNQSSRPDYRDELQDSDRETNDPTFAFIQSDIVKTKRRRLRRGTATVRGPTPVSSLGGNSDVELEFRRRSSRTNRSTRAMADSYVEDDEIFNLEEEKAPITPKVVGMREVFQTTSYDFKEAHQTVCDSCGLDERKAPLIGCQGCSSSYHKACLGVRSVREHRVTKVADDSFVIQCRFCVGVYKQKDVRAPSHDICQGCHTRNQSCVPFSERKTMKQEETLRNDNGGVDPITPVDPKLVNNPENVFFRCGRCRRAWHYEHLPHPNRSRDPAIDDPLNLRKHRRQEYQITWMCKECQDTEEEKVDKLVAWRPRDANTYKPGQPITDFEEDDLEYLLKWENKSYNHCVWMPGAWVHGVVKTVMRQAFVKRTFGESSGEAIDDERQHVDSLLRWTKREAIHDSWITPDIILDVHYAPRTREAEKKYSAKSIRDRFKDDLGRIHDVVKIYTKFEGLGYDDVVWDTPPAPDAGPSYDAFREAYREFLNGRHFQSEPWKNMVARIDEFRQRDFCADIEVKRQPRGLRRGKLMQYQLDGLNWMLYNFRENRSVVLADEMGLGKTVQVVALLSSFIQDNPRVWPFLIVVPNATCANWRREIKKWAPDLRVVAYYGGKVSQNLSLQYELFPNGARELKAHVVIMSYESAKDSETRSRFSNTKWAGLVVDEAQALKNDENTLYRALHALRISFKLLLTGTPLQNNKRELFNLLQFIDPSFKAEQLDEQFAQITSENLPQLHSLIRPYFLRRTKAEVLTFLPPMAQIILPVSMTVLQERLCKSIMERNPELIRSVFVQGKLKTHERGSLSNILMQLRKCLCHPFIYSQAIEDRTLSPEVARRNLIEASSKLMLLEIMLPKLKERGHRVLLFSQFLDQLTVMEDFLAGLGLRHERLDGRQSSMQKQKIIDAFNAPDSDIFAMLLSTRAGGVGINLATADTVIILDPDWNPHQDIQALSRAHRIGQRKKVLCFQLMTVDSVEEKILQIGRKKLALDHLLIETMDNEEDAPNDVESVLKHGAAALFGEGKKKEAITYDSAAVDKLLDRSMVEETKTGEDKSAESAFAFARIWANDEGALAEDLQETERTISLSVWDQILQQRAEEARREAEHNMEKLGRGGRRRGVANYTGPKFEFDENQEAAAAAESDWGSADGDFVGRNNSEAGTSDGDTVQPGEFDGTNTWKPGSKGTRKSPSKAAARSASRTPATPKAKASKPIASKTNSSRKGKQTPNRSTPKTQSGNSMSPATPATPKSRAQTPQPSQSSGRRQPKTPTKKMPSLNKNPTKGVGRAKAQVQRANKLPLRPLELELQEQGKQPGDGPTAPGQGTAQQEQQHQQHQQHQQENQFSEDSTQPKTIPKIPSHAHTTTTTSVASPLSSTATTRAVHPNHVTTPLLRAGSSTSPPAASAAEPLSWDFCFVCEHSHPATWECPEMKSEVRLRLLLDELRHPLGKDTGGKESFEAVLRAQQRRAFLLGKLRRIKAEHQETATRSAVQKEKERW
ncbi:PHD/FYVE-zinc-finger like domain-containing protein [Corynascus similis CBS 632.67]